MGEGCCKVRMTVTGDQMTADDSHRMLRMYDGKTRVGSQKPKSIDRPPRTPSGTGISTILLHASSDLLPTVLEQLTTCLCDLHCVTTRTCVKRVVLMHVVAS